MPVYEAENYEKVIKRIQGKIDALHIKMGECLSEEAIAAFEDRHNVRLPLAYRIFFKRWEMAVSICLEAAVLTRSKAARVRNCQNPSCLKNSGFGKGMTGLRTL